MNEIRSEISKLRAEMLRLEGSIRVQINRDLDCTESSLRLMALRREMLELLRRRKIAGGSDRCPTVTERLKENPGPPQRPNKLLRSTTIRW